MNRDRSRFLRIIPCTFLRVMAAVAILNAVGNQVSAQVICSWVSRYDGPASGTDAASALVTDAAGNVYVTGSSAGVGTGVDYATIKYNSVGDQLWVARYNGPGNGDDLAYSIALDANGNVYVTGSSWGIGTDYDYTTIKYDSEGVIQWIARYEGPGDSTDTAMSIAVDEDGNACITGWSWGAGTHYDYATIKYDPAGIELWAVRYDGPVHWVDMALATAMDALGNVYVTGESWGGDDIATDYATIKYSPSGDQLWVTRYNNTWAYMGYSIDIARDLVLDENGSVYLTGGSFGYSFYDFETIQYDSAGSELWRARWDGWNGQNDEAYAIALDHSGNVLVAGYGMFGNGVFVTIKYDRIGSEQWMQTYDAGTCVLDLSIDLYNNVYVTGLSSDYATIRYSPDGIQQWVERYDGPGNDADNSQCITVDAGGNVYVTGSSTGNGTGLDYATIKYSPTVMLSLTPYGSPIQIPVAGGSFDYNIELINNSTSVISCDVWCMVTLPDGGLYGPVLGPARVMLSGSSSLNRDRTQLVPARAPAGDYAFQSYVGIYPDAIWNQDSFDFQKFPAAGESITVGNWGNYGEAFSGDKTPGEASFAPTEFRLYPCFPNPFNPTTTIRFELPEAALVKLEVFDVNGRSVGAIHELPLPPGTHEVPFDGSGLPSGMYIYRLTAGDWQAAGKMVLLK
ncbi:MAG: SBBP repeat-containing protein [bacterium]